MAIDLNAKSEEWHSVRTDIREQVLGELMAKRGLITINKGSEPTRFHQGFGSVINVTFANYSLAHRIKNWRVCDCESGSDHRYVHFEVWTEGCNETDPVLRQKKGRWTV